MCIYINVPVLVSYRKLYVTVSMILCLLLCSLILYFLFPRSVSIAPMSVMSVMVYFPPDTVLMKVTVS